MAKKRVSGEISVSQMNEVISVEYKIDNFFQKIKDSTSNFNLTSPDFTIQNCSFYIVLDKLCRNLFSYSEEYLNIKVMHKNSTEILLSCAEGLCISKFGIKKDDGSHYKSFIGGPWLKSIFSGRNYFQDTIVSISELLEKQVEISATSYLRLFFDFKCSNYRNDKFYFGDKCLSSSKPTILMAGQENEKQLMQKAEEPGATLSATNSIFPMSKSNGWQFENSLFSFGASGGSELPFWNFGQPDCEISALRALSTKLEDMFLKELLCDMTIKIGEKDFRVHKCIMAARSPWFAKKFQEDIEENKLSTMHIADCDPDVFKEFLRYLYSSKIDKLSNENALNLYDIAHKYQADALKANCVSHLSKNLSVEYFCDIIQLATRHAEFKLLKHSKYYFVNNARNIIQTVKWIPFMTENATLATELILLILPVSSVNSSRRYASRPVKNTT